MFVLSRLHLFFVPFSKCFFWSHVPIFLFRLSPVVFCPVLRVFVPLLFFCPVAFFVARPRTSFPKTTSVDRACNKNGGRTGNCLSLPGMGSTETRGIKNRGGRQVWVECSAVLSFLVKKPAMTSTERGRGVHHVLIQKLNCLQAR